MQLMQLLQSPPVVSPVLFLELAPRSGVRAQNPGQILPGVGQGQGRHPCHAHRADLQIEEGVAGVGIRRGVVAGTAITKKVIDTETGIETVTGIVARTESVAKSRLTVTEAVQDRLPDHLHQCLKAPPHLQGC